MSNINKKDGTLKNYRSVFSAMRDGFRVDEIKERDDGNCDVILKCGDCRLDLSVSKEKLIKHFGIKKLKLLWDIC